VRHLSRERRCYQH